MDKKIEKTICCGIDAIRTRSKATGLYKIQCSICNKEATGRNEEEVAGIFNAQVSPPQIAMPPMALPTANTLPQYMSARMRELTMVAPPFVENQALTRLVKNSIRHVMLQKSPAMVAVWQSPEGQESIVHALEESIAMGCELPKMGSIVPFGGAVEFIPAVEGFEFYLTAGRNPPFKDIEIVMIHENDSREKLERVGGNFVCDIKMGIPRGEVIAVAVYGFNNKLDRVIGEVYDVERLLAKAEQHSAGYKSFLRQVKAFAYKKSQGEVKVDAEGREYADIVLESANGDKYHEQNLARFKEAEEKNQLKTDGKGEYCVIKMPKKNSDETWDLKIYRRDIENPGTETKRLYIDDITNPYDGPDRPEMLRKGAGKSFLGKYAKVRNSEAAQDEARQGTQSQAEASVDASLDAAFVNIDTPAPDFDTPPPPRTEKEAEPADVDDTTGDTTEGEPDISDELEELAGGRDTENGELDI